MSNMDLQVLPAQATLRWERENMRLLIAANNHEICLIQKGRSMTASDNLLPQHGLSSGHQNFCSTK
jgi:hypothetical protein